MGSALSQFGTSFGEVLGSELSSVIYEEGQKITSALGDSIHRNIGIEVAKEIGQDDKFVNFGKSSKEVSVSLCYVVLLQV